MEGRVRLICSQCGRWRELAGEIPMEYVESFLAIVREDGFVPRPGSPALSLICGTCLRMFEGHESVDDEEKVRRG